MQTITASSYLACFSAGARISVIYETTFPLYRVRVKPDNPSLQLMVVSGDDKQLTVPRASAGKALGLACGSLPGPRALPQIPRRHLLFT